MPLIWELEVSYFKVNRNVIIWLWLTWSLPSSHGIHRCISRSQTSYLHKLEVARVQSLVIDWWKCVHPHSMFFYAIFIFSRVADLHLTHQTLYTIFCIWIFNCEERGIITVTNSNRNKEITSFCPSVVNNVELMWHVWNGSSFQCFSNSNDWFSETVVQLMSKQSAWFVKIPPFCLQNMFGFWYLEIFPG